ncbi:MAG: hypothetical protein IKL57_06615 [Oscillospiraceae bacterium]|nr:hypothetical protein [Oscillospiraceae bacterium]
MKKAVSVFLFLVLIISFGIPALGAEMQVFLYAPEEEILAMLENSESYLVKSLEADNISIDAKKVMPVFHANFSEYAEKGVLKYEQDHVDGKPLYACDVFDKNGKHAGYITFTKDDLMMFAPKESGGGTSIDYSAALNAAGVENCIFARLMWLEGAGYVFYAEETNGEYLVRSYIKGSNEDLFSGKRKVSVSEAFSFVQKSSVESVKDVPAFVPNENPPTGAAVPFAVFAMIAFSAALSGKK